MERELPVYQLKGFNFHVDVKNAELIEIDTPYNNRIKLNDLEDLGSHYVLYWNIVDKNNDNFKAYLRRQSDIDLKRDGFVEHIGYNIFKKELKKNVVKVPPLKILDPIGMSELYNVSLARMDKMSDFEIMVDQEVLLKRKFGVLPILKIGNHDFLVNLKSDVVEPLFPSQVKTIKFSKIEEYTKPNGLGYNVPWDMKTGQIAHLDYRSLTELPKNVRFVDIPMKQNLDAYGYYRLYGTDMELKTALRTFPIKDKVIARIQDWNETTIPILIEYNIGRNIRLKEDRLESKKIKHRIKRGI